MSAQNNTPLDLWHLELIGLLEARRNGFTGTGEDVEVIVLDTRPQLSHPAFKDSKVTLYVLEQTASSSDSSYALKEIPKDEFRSLTVQQSHPHGTAVLGLLCGKDIGVSPNATVIFICLEPKHSSSQTGWYCSFAELTQALGLSKEFPNTLINLSLGIASEHPTGPTASFEETLKSLCQTLESRYECLLFSSSGNVGANQRVIPAAFRGVLSVGSCDKDQRIPSKSGSGPSMGGYMYPFLVAPGENVYSTTIGGVYKYCTGTSFATPIAVAVATLFREEAPFLSVEELRDRLGKACVLLKDTPEERQGHGLLRCPWSPQQSLADTEKEAHTIQDKSPQNAAITEKEGNMEENKFLVPSGLSTKICEDLAEEIRHAAPNTLVQAILLLNDAEGTTSFPRLSQRDFPTRQDYKRALLERGLDYVSKKVQPILDKLESIPLRIHRGSELFGMIHIEGTAQEIQRAATLPEVRRIALNAKLQAPTDSISSSASPISRPVNNLPPNAPSSKISPELAKQLNEAASNEFLQAVLFLDGFEPNQRPSRPSHQNDTDKQADTRDFFEQQRTYAQEKAKVVIDKLKGMNNLRVIEGAEIFGTIDIDGTPEAIQQAALLPEVIRATSNARLSLPMVSEESSATTRDTNTTPRPTLIEEPTPIKEPKLPGDMQPTQRPTKEEEDVRAAFDEQSDSEGKLPDLNELLLRDLFETVDRVVRVKMAREPFLEAEADDVVQEVFLDFIRQLPRLLREKPNLNVRAYLSALARSYVRRLFHRKLLRDKAVGNIERMERMEGEARQKSFDSQLEARSEIYALVKRFGSEKAVSERMLYEYSRLAFAIFDNGENAENEKGAAGEAGRRD